MADLYNTVIDQGATWSLLVTYKDPEGDPINLSNATAAMQLRTSPLARTAQLTLDTSPTGGIIINGSAGELEITATAAQTEDLPPQKYTYDLEVYLGSQVIRLLQGTIIVNAETTRI